MVHHVWIVMQVALRSDMKTCSVCLLRLLQQYREAALGICGSSGEVLNAIAWDVWVLGDIWTLGCVSLVLLTGSKPFVPMALGVADEASLLLHFLGYVATRIACPVTYTAYCIL